MKVSTNLRFLFYDRKKLSTDISSTDLVLLQKLGDIITDGTILIDIEEEMWLAI